MQGLIFIPDITGFTRFVKSVDMDLGMTITMDLLNEIIDNNPLDLQISEIEGDAILFYKMGKPIPLMKILAAFSKMYEAFEKRIKKWKAELKLDMKLSLKFILHYGNMNVFHIRGFKKLYGQSVIESHRLLKNGSDASSYILITEDYMKALPPWGDQLLMQRWKQHAHASQKFTELREISYYFFNYVPARPQGVCLADTQVRA